jgi:small subunit ribosomal protein S2
VVDYVIPGNDDALRAIRLFTTKIADSAAEGVQMVSEKAYATEVADVRQAEVAPEYVGEEGEFTGDDASAEVHESAGIAAASTDDLGDDENVDLEAVLGGNIRKAPTAAVEEEVEPEPAHAASGA